MDLQFSHLIISTMNTSQSAVTISKFVKVCYYYAELSCIAMDYERSHVEMCAVVLSFANIYICASFFRTFHKYKTNRCQLACGSCGSFRCVVLRKSCGAEAYVAAFSQVGPILPCSPIIYSLWDCLILIMLVNLRKEASELRN